ncbi:unnamed protein product, partial [marine sediment metagenome]
MNKNSSPVLKGYVYFIFIAGLSVFAYILLRYGDVSILGVVLFGLLAFAA